MPVERRIGIEAHIVRYESDVAFRSFLLSWHSISEQVDIAAILFDERHQNSDRRCLTGAIRSDEAHDLPALERERDVVEIKEGIVFADAAHFDGWCCHTTLFFLPS